MKATINTKMTDTALVPASKNALLPVTPAGSLESYISFANSAPMLTESEEITFAKRLRENGDIDAAQRLIIPHLRFVIKVARGFSGYGLAMADLIQEGNIGLMKAVKRFDPTMGVRLVSFAVHWIKAEIHEFVIKNWRIVKIATTKAQRKLFFNLRSQKKRLGWFSRDEIDNVAKELNVSAKDVIEMERRLNAHDAAFDAPIEASDDEVYAPAQYLEAPEADPAEHLAETQSEDTQLSLLSNALETIDARSRDIIAARWLAEKKATLHDLAAKYNVSAERIRQIETAAMKKLKAGMVA